MRPTTSTLDGARAYVESGWAVVPVPRGQKGPTITGWPALRLAVADLPQYFGSGESVGVITGDASGGLVDVDLDTPEAVRLASAFLPETNLIHGRPGKPASHRWYRLLRAVQPSQFRATDGTMIVELRTGPGQQTIVPPSRHPSGETVQWEAEGHPAQVDGVDLRRAVARLAAAALLARAWPQPGARHDAALALAGALLRAGWSDEETADFVRAVAEVAGDEEARVRARDVVSTARRQGAERPTTGLPTLAALVGEDVAERVREWLGLRAAARSPMTGGRAKQADVLVGLAEAVELFVTFDGTPYASLPVGDHVETWPVRSRTFRRWLSGRYFEQTKTAPSAQPMTDALTVLEARALFGGLTIPVFVRMAEHGDAIYLDLADEQWRAVQITSAGWRILTDPPVRFRRPGGMLALPVPVLGGSVGELSRFINLDGDAFRLYISTLVAALRPRGPYPIPIIEGEQGSAKSTLARVGRALVDPNAAALRAAPREVRDIMIAAKNGWMLAFDNLSRIPPWLSDALCRLATGGGFGVRTLYTDEEETLFDAQRPIILNGITDIATRPDLLDRAVMFRLEPILEERRLPEEAFWRTFEEARPQILGALLDVVSAALRALPTVRLDRHPRMADFARWSVAAAPALGWTDAMFLRAYGRVRTAAHELALEASPIGCHLLDLAEQGWTGTVGELYQELEARADERQRRQPGWPRSARGVASALQILAADFRAVGVAVKYGSRTRTGRRLTLERVGEASSRSSRPTLVKQRADSGGDGWGDGRHGRPEGQPQSSPPKAAQDAAGDGRDGCERPVPTTFSTPEPEEAVIE